jgi:hypothetical protein
MPAAKRVNENAKLAKAKKSKKSKPAAAAAAKASKTASREQGWIRATLDLL